MFDWDFSLKKITLDIISNLHSFRLEVVSTAVYRTIEANWAVYYYSTANLHSSAHSCISVPITVCSNCLIYRNLALDSKYSIYTFQYNKNSRDCLLFIKVTNKDSRKQNCWPTTRQCIFQKQKSTEAVISWRNLVFVNYKYKIT